MTYGQQLPTQAEGRSVRAALSWHPSLEVAAIFLILLATVISLQYLAGAFSAEFDIDAGFHYVSGVMIRDYIVAGFPATPKRYLLDFYGHYPLPGIGHWPPLYYAVEAVWMLLFSSGRTAVLLLSAVVTTSAALILYVSTARSLGRLAGILVALVFVATPIVQHGSRELKLDIPVTLMCLASMLAYVRYLATRHARYSLLFGLLASAAIMIKGNGACLAFLPPFAVLFGRRFDLLARPSFWAPAAIVLVLTGPWYVLTYGLAASTFFYPWGWTYTGVALPFNVQMLFIALGPLVVGAAVLGLIGLIVTPRSRQGDPTLIGTASLTAAVFLFQAVVPVDLQERYLAPIVPPLLMLAAFGLQRSARWLARVSPRRIVAGVNPALAQATVAGLVVLTFLPAATKIDAVPHLGLIEAARQIWANRIADNPTVLIAADVDGEVALITELAMTDEHRPSLYTVRGFRLLGSGSSAFDCTDGGVFAPKDCGPRFGSPEEAMAEIDRYAISLVLVQTRQDGQALRHLRQLQEAERLFPDRWKLLYEDASHDPAIRLYRIIGNDVKRPDVSELIAMSGPRSLTHWRGFHDHD